MKEIILPPHLYDRIKASAGEHGGVGSGGLFEDKVGSQRIIGSHSGVPLCAHGHAWGTCTRFQSVRNESTYEEPELTPFVSFDDNDDAVQGERARIGCNEHKRISFDRWCELLNVKRGKDEDYVQAPSESDAEREASLV